MGGLLLPYLINILKRLFYLKISELLKKILFSNLSFSDINSQTNTNNNGRLACISVVTYENIILENCTFEHCKDASKGGVFYLYGTSKTVSYIYLRNMKFVNNWAIENEYGNDIYCAASSCLTADGKTVIERYEYTG
jgi:hypothetical protein